MIRLPTFVAAPASAAVPTAARAAALAATLAVTLASLASVGPVLAQDAPGRVGEIGREGATRGGSAVSGRAPADAGTPAAAPLDPWSREVAVADRGPEERREAQSLAMRAVLLANSGDKTLLNRDEVRAGLRDAERFVERFDYRTPPPGTLIPADTPLTDAVRESGEATQLMRIAFDRGLLGELIAGSGEPADAAAADEADGESPDPLSAVDEALVWLLIEDGRREIMIADPAARNVRARAREIAGARGVALRYPAGDDEDRAMLDAADLREGALDRLRVASERYGVPVVLAGRLARDGLGAWEGRWTKLAGEAVEETSVSTGSLDEALQEGLAWLSAAAGDDTYRYGGASTSDTEALVWVGALDSIAAYATVMDFLEGVPGVGTVYPREIDERGMTFTVVPRGALPAIASAANGLSWLRRTNPPEEPSARGRTARSTTAGGERYAGAGRGADDVSPTGTEGDPAGRTGDGGTDASREPVRSLAGDAELAFDYLR